MIEPGALVDDPRWLLHRIDFSARLLGFVRTDRSVIARSAFIDGRTPLGEDGAEPLRVRFEDVLPHVPPAPARPRFLLHHAFCGSTALARRLDAPGLCLAWKEPQSLIDLAQAPGGPELADDVATMERLVAHKFARGFDGEPAIVKPSNWVNGALGRLYSEHAAAVAHVAISDRDLLVAVLRGGRERMAYAARLYGWLAARLGGVDLGDAALPPVERVARMALAGLRMQRCAIGDLYKRRGEAPHETDYRAVLHDIDSAAVRIADRLGVTLSAAAGPAAHAKDQQRPFSASEQDAVDVEVDRHYHALIARTLDWAQELQ